MNQELSIIAQIKQACKKAFVFVGIFSFFINLLMLTVPIYMLQIFDRVLASYSPDTLLFLTIIAAFLIAIMASLSIARSFVMIKVSRWLDNRLSTDALLRGADEILSGRPYAMQSLRDISTLRQTISGAAILTLFDAPWVPIYLIVIFLLHPVLGIIATIGAIVLFTLAWINELATKFLLFRANMVAQANNQKMSISLRNSESIQAMGMLPQIIDSWFHTNEKVLNDQEAASRRASTILSISRFIRLFLQVLMLGVGAYFVIHDQLTAGMMIAGTILLSRALAPVEQAIGAWTQLSNAREAYLRLKAYLTQAATRPAQMELPEPVGKIQFEHVNYAPPGREKPILKKISFTLPAGETLAVIGPSAAGKTTLARLIIGAYQPNKGHVRLDGADVYTWERSAFGKYVGYLPQSVELFSGTIKDNIARMEKDADPEKISQAAILAGAHEMILQFPEGYDTDLADGGTKISGGQRQRIALARALYNEPKLIVLDEPNSSLDSAGEEALSRAIKQLKEKGSTIVVVSHRPNVLSVADRILLLMNGELKLYGPRDKVLERLKQEQEARK